MLSFRQHYDSVVHTLLTMDVRGVSTTRRRVLRGAGTVAALSLAGCLDTDTDDADNQDADTVDSDTEDSGSGDSGTSDPNTDDSESGESESVNGETEDSEHLTALRSYLEENSIMVEEISLDDDQRVVTVEYETKQTGEEELAAEIGTISGGGMQRLEEGWEIERFEALMIQNGEPIATWYMERTWFEEFESGERTPDELSVQILNTLEFVE